MSGEAERDLGRALDELSEVAVGAGQPLRLQARVQLERWARVVVQWRRRAGLTSLSSAASVVRELMTPAAFALQLLDIGEGAAARVSRWLALPVGAGGIW